MIVIAESIHPNLYYKWSKEFLEAGKRRLAGGTVPVPTTRYSSAADPGSVHAPDNTRNIDLEISTILSEVVVISSSCQLKQRSF